LFMSERKINLILFFFFFFCYLLFHGDYSSNAFYSSDEVFYFRLTTSLVHDRSLEIEPYLGYSHSKYMPGQSLAGIPSYLVARGVSLLFPAGTDPSIFILTILHLTNILIGGGLCLLFYRFSRELGYHAGTGVAGALTLGLATAFFPYSKQYFADPLVALLLLFGVRSLFRMKKGIPREGIMGGLWFGAAVLTKIDSAFLVPAAGIWIVLVYGRRSIPFLVRFIIGLAPFALLVLLYNHLNYGHALRPGYSSQGFASPFLAGLYGLLLSPGRGLFLFSPPVLLFLFGWSRFRKNHPRLLGLCLLILAFKLAILAKWFSWQGGWSWGCRLLLPVIPLLMLPALELFENWRNIKPGGRMAVLVLLIAGVAVQISGTLVNPNRYNNDIWGMLPGGMNEFLFIPQLSTISGNFFLLSRGKLDLGWFSLIGGGGGAFCIGFALNLGAALFLGGLLLREMGLGRPGWLSLFLPESKKVLITCILVVGISVFCHLVMRGQGLEGLRRTWLEHPRNTGTPSLPRRFSGYLYTPVGGSYRFDLKVRGTYHITLDGTPLFSSDRVIPQHWDHAERELGKGYHAFRGIYTPRGDSDIALAHLYWTIPDGGIYKGIIGPSHLFRQKPGLLRELLMHIVRFRAWLFLLALFLPWIRWRRNRQSSI